MPVVENCKFRNQYSGEEDDDYIGDKI